MAGRDLSGLRFGRYTVLYRVEDHIASSGRRYPQYLCRCDCGTEKKVLAQALTSGTTQSCGCYSTEVKRQVCIERNTIHGYAHRVGERDRLYSLWTGIKNRCYNENDRTYQRYGARGITMCDEWRDDFMEFHDWALDNGYDYDAPRGQCTIDRIDYTQGYFPENCRFVDNYVQADNKSNVIHVTYNGETKNLSEWGRTFGIKPHTLQRRYDLGDRDDDLFRPIYARKLKET